MMYDWPKLHVEKYGTEPSCQSWSVLARKLPSDELMLASKILLHNLCSAIDFLIFQQAWIHFDLTVVSSCFYFSNSNKTATNPVLPTEPPKFTSFKYFSFFVCETNLLCCSIHYYRYNRYMQIYIKTDGRGDFYSCTSITADNFNLWMLR